MWRGQCRREGGRLGSSWGAAPGPQGSWGHAGLSSSSSGLQLACRLAFPAATLATDTSGMAWLSWDERGKWGCCRCPGGPALSVPGPVERPHCRDEGATAPGGPATRDEGRSGWAQSAFPCAAPASLSNDQTCQKPRHSMKMKNNVENKKIQPKISAKAESKT